MNYIDIIAEIDEEIKSITDESMELNRQYHKDRSSVSFEFPYRLTYKDVIYDFLKTEDFKTYEDARNFVRDNDISGTYTITDMMLQMLTMFEEQFDRKHKFFANRIASLQEVRAIFYSKLSDEDKGKVGHYRGWL